jgi:hypothetical protein
MRRFELTLMNSKMLRAKRMQFTGDLMDLDLDRATHAD